MKKLSCVLLVFVLMFSLFACGDTIDTTNYTDPAENENLSSKDEFYRDHQELTSSETDFDADTMLRIDIPEVGLENVYIAQMSEFMYLDADTVGRVYLIGDDRYGGGMSTSDYYIAVSANDKLYVKDLTSEEYGSSASMGATLYFPILTVKKATRYFSTKQKVCQAVQDSICPVFMISKTVKSKRFSPLMTRKTNITKQVSIVPC